MQYKGGSLMGKILALIIIAIIIGMCWSLPLYLCGNFVLWLFNINFHLTWLQAFGICLLTTVLKNLIKTKGKED